MDTSDPNIKFDENGICNHCKDYDLTVQKYHLNDSKRINQLNEIVEIVKREGKNREYDCIIGVSGGVDSTYAALRVKQLGLRPLAVHLDNGWDSEIAVSNIEKALNKLQIELYTHVINWGEFRDLQLAFLRASTPDSEIPSDHAIVALMYHTAKKFGVKYVITGYNFRTESHLPSAWSQGHYDWLYIKSIQKQFGHSPINTFPHLNFLELIKCRIDQKIHGRWINILNFLDYRKEDAMRVLQEELGWKYYGGKHFESIYTRFYQGYYLPLKFGFDKRKTHLSSLICSEEITKAAALQQLQLEPYSPALMEEDREFVEKKLGVSDDEFEALLKSPPKSFWDYPSYTKWTNNFIYKSIVYVYKRIST